MPTSKSTSKSKRAPRARRATAAEPKLWPVNEWFALRRSPIHGTGAVTIRSVPRGTRIIEYTGDKISNAEGDRRYKDSPNGQDFTFLFVLNSKQMIDGGVGGNEARFINHSCEPNCEIVIARGRIWITAGQDIP